MTIEVRIRIRFIERISHERIKGLLSALFLKSILIGDWTTYEINEVNEVREDANNKSKRTR